MENKSTKQPSSLKERLTEILLKNKLLTQQQLDEALELQRQKGGRLSEIITELKFVRENDLILALSEGLGFPVIDLKRLRIDYDTVKIIPAEIARRYQIVSISKMGDTVTLAMADPLNIFAIDHVCSLTGYKINPIISSVQDILQTIEHAYPDSTGGVIDELVKQMSASSLELVKEEKETLPSHQELSRISREAPVIKLTNLILEEAVERSSSDVLIEPLEKKLRIRFRIDGLLQERDAPPKNMHAPIISRLKVMSDLNIAEHRLPQDGRFKAKIAGREVDFRISILPSSLGEKAAIRILDQSQASLNLDKLGFSSEGLERLKKAAMFPHGMILVCGPTGSGKTTTLYAILKFVDSPEKNIVTVEDPVEYQLEGINQVTARPQIGLSFASALRAILRQDPNVIMVGEIRDYETVDIAIKSALTGHLVISSLHTTTASGAIVRLVNMGVESYLINSALCCVLVQRLLRRLCPKCKEPYQAAKESLSALRLPPASEQAAQFFRPRGCSSCFNSGYSSRVAIAEVLPLSHSIRELILSRPQEHLIKEQARKEGMRTLRQEGLRLALAGLTSIEEVIRVTAPDE
jgi:type IV pilus assembly protein PilB